jgi:hypothetical protein
MTNCGKTEGEIRERWRRDREGSLSAFASGETALCVNLLPVDAIALTDESLLDVLRSRHGDSVDAALSPEWTDPDCPTRRMPRELQGPVVSRSDTSWLGTTNMVGVNVRTIGTFINVVKYSLTLSAVQDSIHLLPLWEPGVVGSLYGMSSWKVNDEFLSSELHDMYPHLATPDRQLRATVNLLHLTGRAVGMDVIPHTDRFSEIVLAHPHHFEWVRREDLSIVDQRANLHEEVQARVVAFLREHGSADPTVSVPAAPLDIFDPDFDEATRDRLIFGTFGDRSTRSVRRRALARSIYNLGYEPVPATMAPPFRGLDVDRDAMHVDADGHIWREYRITRPESMSRVFGPLTRYKLYERHDDNREWRIDFDRPRSETWEYVQDRYGAMQRRFGFDFMRGDMSHVQMRPDGVPLEPDAHYDLLGSVRSAIAETNGAPWFGYFAETFVAPPGIMGYGSEIDHLEASGADVTLGDLQSVPIDSAEFVQRFRWYRDILTTRRVRPAFTVMTADKDDPRFDEFYRAGNEARFLMSLFLTDMPSYMGLNFECRDPHFDAAPNEYYTKLYVFQESDGPKAVSGPFRFGRNGYLFYRITRIRLFADEMVPRLRGATVHWLVPPDATAGQGWLAWALDSAGLVGPADPSDPADPADGDARRAAGGGSVAAGGTLTDGDPAGDVLLVCVVNLDTNHGPTNLRVPLPPQSAPGAERSVASALHSGGATSGARGLRARLLFSTDERRESGQRLPVSTATSWIGLPDLGPGEGIVIALER